jgi:hypothetical protein
MSPPPSAAPGASRIRGLFRRLRRRSPRPTPVPEEPHTPPPASTSRLLLPFLALARGAYWLLDILDRVLVCFAVPFGVNVRDPWRRYALLLGAFAVIYLGFGYIGVLGIGRAWVLNEKRRTAIVKKLEHTDPDQLPDLRWTALVSVLQLLILFPMLFMQVQRHFHLYAVHGETIFWDWLWFTLDKTYLKALPDWSILYGVHISSIEFDRSWGRHLVLLARLTVDYILIQGMLRLLAIRATINEAVAAVKADPEMAVRLGRRAIGPLVEKLADPDRAVRGAAANALVQLGHDLAVQPLLPVAATESHTEGVEERQ